MSKQMWLIAHLTHKLHVAEVVRKNLDYVG